MRSALNIRHLLLTALLMAGVRAPTPLRAQEDAGDMQHEGATMGHDQMSEHDQMSRKEGGPGASSMMFMGTGSHKAAGDYEIVEADGKRQIRFTDDFSVGDAPDLHVVLSVGETADHDALDLGKLERRQGRQTYELPASADLARYHKLLIWSRKLNRAVASAELPAAGGSMGHM
jgi:hypothetical protein